LIHIIAVQGKLAYRPAGGAEECMAVPKGMYSEGPSGAWGMKGGSGHLRAAATVS